MKSDEEEVKGFSSPSCSFENVIFEQAANGCYLICERKEGKLQAVNDPKTELFRSNYPIE